MTPFAFLSPEWPDVHQAAAKAWQLALPEPRTACFYARRALELCVEWLYTADASLHRPYDNNVSARIHEPTFKRLVGEPLFLKARLVIATGNRAVHQKAPIPVDEAATAVSELFHLTYWVARTYARGARPDPALQFKKGELPHELPPSPTTRAQLQRLAADNQKKDEETRLAREENAALKAEVAALRAEVELAKKKAAEFPDTHDYSEADTRREYIDLLLREAGWPLANEEDREYKVHGMPNAEQVGYVDYVLWGDDGKPLGLVEAKRTSKSAQQGQQQAKLYADCLEAQYGQRPLIFYTNGYETWLWDDTQSAPRQVQGFYTKEELALAIQRRTSRKRLIEETINDEIVNRQYQHHAVRSVCAAFDHDHERKALLVMATGTGKTRTVIALCDVLMRANWVKRVLFLADRKVLVKQAVNAFKSHLPDTAPVNLLKDKESEGRVYVATYPTIMGLIDRVDDDTGRRFGPGYFDLVVIDEAHRSVYQKYGAIFRYFDARLVGLTATPRDDLDHDTYSLFELEDGVPTDAFELADAIDKKVLVPSRAISVPLKFQRQGITYAELSEEEKERWDELEWDAEDGTPSHVDPAALNDWLMNIDTVDKVLAHLMERGQHVAGGDRLGKTIIFAKNQAHAEFIAKRFDANYPHFKGTFARVIHNKVDYVEALIDDFSSASKEPHIAISVDMLDTGVDVPEVVNLVFFKMVRSKTKFWQMVGRGTRLCPNLFGPDQDKEFFYIFDYCQNLEYFAVDSERSEGSVGASLKQRLFVARLELLKQLDRPTLPDPGAPFRGTGHPSVDLSPDTYRGELATGLCSEVAAMNVNNFVVRPQVRAVQRYADAANWKALSDDDTTVLVRDVAHLPTELPAEGEEAKRFDHLLYRLELAVLRGAQGTDKLVEQTRSIASLLEEKAAIPAVAEQLALIEDLQTDAYWEDITVPMLERARRSLRGLVRLIEKKKRKVIYTDFADQFGEETVVDLPGFSKAEGFERFRAKLRAYLRLRTDHLTLHKLRTNKPLTQSDLDALEDMLVTSGAASEADLDRAKTESEGLGLFIRSLVGLDREAASEAFSTLLGKRRWTAEQIRFVDMIIKHLTEHGVMKPDLLYESPFTDVAPTGPDALFKEDDVTGIFEVLEHVRATAIAS